MRPIENVLGAAFVAAATLASIVGATRDAQA